jgi:hypothetical protein
VKSLANVAGTDREHVNRCGQISVRVRRIAFQRCAYKG